MRTAVALVALLLGTGCGSRTGLLVGLPNETSDASSGDDASFDAGCPSESNPWLLFDSIDGDPDGGIGIYAMRADGTHGHMLDLPNGPGLYPSVSPGGDQLLYAVALPTDAGADGGPDSAIYMYDIASKTAKLVVADFDVNYSALSPDGLTVSYVTNFSMNAVGSDGTNVRMLLAGPNGCGTGYGHPVFEADSHSIVYGTGGAVGVIQSDGSGNQVLLSETATLEYPNPAFSPDYQRIVLGITCDQTTTQALRIYDFASLPASCDDGSVLTAVDESSGFNSGANDPSWSSTGLIAYAADKDVYVIDANGGTPRNMTAALTLGNTTATDPVWAPGCAPIP